MYISSEEYVGIKGYILEEKGHAYISLCIYSIYHTFVQLALHSDCCATQPLSYSPLSTQHITIYHTGLDYWVSINLPDSSWCLKGSQSTQFASNQLYKGMNSFLAQQVFILYFQGQCFRSHWVRFNFLQPIVTREARHQSYYMYAKPNILQMHYVASNKVMFPFSCTKINHQFTGMDNNNNVLI